jgi:lysophospholipase L1-like esterase
MSRPVALLSAALLALLLVPPAAPAQKKRDLYVALGDSYTSGYQPTGPGRGRNTRNGFVYQLVPLARRRGYEGVKLVNFGCGGETSVSLLRRTRRCGGPVPGGENYAGRTQMAASERFLRRNRDRIAFVTVLIGGNDVTACVSAPDPIACVGPAAERVKRNVTTIGRRLRRAVGSKVPIIAGTYPDVILGLWTSGRKQDQDLAALSTIAFRSIINPALEAAYEANDITFVDVTEATGAYGSFEQTTTIDPYGTVPVPVATICEISYFCVFRDIHLRTNGYRQMAELFAAELPRGTARARARRR